MENLLVTGGAGFIGSHVVDEYIANGLEVVVVDDLSTGRLSNLNPSAAFYKLDIRSPQMAELFNKEKPDYVNHHAAQMDVRKSVEDPLFDADVAISKLHMSLHISSLSPSSLTSSAIPTSRIRCTSSLLFSST